MNMAKMGRPPKKASEKHSKKILLAVTPGEWRAVRTDAKKAGLTVTGLLLRPWRKGRGE